MRRYLTWVALGCAALLTVTAASACTGDYGPEVLTVFAAASLSEVFGDIAEDFEAEHGDVDVVFSFAGSSDLVSQLEAGAPADVFASANEKQMDRAMASGAVEGNSVLFASNTLTLVTPVDNPAGVTSLRDASDAALVVCAPQVPCGSATQLMADSAGIALRPVSEESSVTDVLGKVTSGQADAGLVYVTDAMRAGDAVNVIDIPEAAAVVNLYPIAALDADDALAQEFVQFVLSGASQDKLRATGFGAPVG